MLRATRRLAARVAIAAVAAVVSTGCDDVSTDGACPSALSVVPVRDEPSDLYNGTAVACSGDDQTVCDNGSGRWETTVSDDCGRTHLSVCSGCFTACSCIHLYLDGARPAIAQVTSVAAIGDQDEWDARGGWVEIAAWAPDEIRGRVALDLGDGWVAGTFDWSVGEDGVPDGAAPP